MSYSFDGSTKIISLTSGTNVLDVKDLWSRYVEWLEIGSNSRWQLAFQQVGGNDIDVVSGTAIPAYIYLINGWRIRPQESSHTLNVTSGVLLVDGGGDPFVDTLGSYMIRVNYSQPVQAITVNTGGGSGTSPALIAAAVWDELTSTHSISGSYGEKIEKLLTLSKFLALK